jgi:glycosyltransferase involved in cell wall biosynthesis
MNATLPVSVVIPAFNAARFVGAALDSLLQERRRVDLDIIVVDDGSADGTREIVAGIAAQAKEIRLLANPGKGIGAARNTGLRNLPPDCAFVTFHDADDISRAGRIEHQSRRLIEDPSIDVLYGLVQIFSTQNGAGLLPAIEEPAKIVRGPYLQSAIFRPSVLKSVGFFDETYRQGCDSDYFLRLVDGDFRIVLEDEIAVYYRRHDTNVTLDAEEMKREFMRASLSWAVRRRMKRKGPLPAIFAEMFLNRVELQNGGAL